MNEETKEKESDAMPKDEADKIRVLVREDKAKYELEIARHQAAIGQIRLYIAECDATLADIDRREAGVKYPEPPKAPEKAEETEAK